MNRGLSIGNEFFGFLLPPEGMPCDHEEMDFMQEMINSKK